MTTVEQEGLVLRHLGLVHHLARKLWRVGRGLEIEDLIGAGTLGLVHAVEGFDRSRGIAFSTYAVPRIRGAMLDEMNRQRSTPRSIRGRERLIRRAEDALQQELKRSPDPAEVARSLGVELTTYRRWVHQIEGNRLVRLDAASSASSASAESTGLHETIADVAAEVPGAEIERQEELRELRRALRSLPARDRRVLVLYYYEGLTCREIGCVLGVSESRVSQIRSRGLESLRIRVAR
jgi:RNA polymerase sigma factor for flagellar operon FliA